MKTGIVFGTFAPMHAGHMSIIERAQKENDKVIVLCCGHEGDRGYPLLPLTERFQRAQEYLLPKGYIVRLFPDTDAKLKEPWDQKQCWNYWLMRMKLMLYEQGDIMQGDILTFYTGETEYQKFLKDEGYKVVRADRSDIPVSATQIRNDPEKYMECIVPTFRTIFRQNH